VEYLKRNKTFVGNSQQLNVCLGVDKHRAFNLKREELSEIFRVVDLCEKLENMSVTSSQALSMLLTHQPIYHAVT
jgi:hypothetical protein